MNYFLAKTDPKTYSIDDLAREKETIWDGVHNYQAIINIKLMKKDDIMILYHSQGDAKIVGAAKITSDSYENKNDPRKSWVVHIKFIKKFQEKDQITLKTIKELGEFNDWALVKQSRLSTMPIPEKFVKWAELDRLVMM